MQLQCLKNWGVFCLLIGAVAAVSACSVLFPAKVPAPGAVHTPPNHVEYWEQHYSENAIINQQPPMPVVDNAPV